MTPGSVPSLSIMGISAHNPNY